MTAADIVRHLEAHGHGVTLDDDGAVVVNDAHHLRDADCELIADHRDQLVEHLAAPLIRAGRAHHQEYLGSLTRIGRALHRQLVHEGSCDQCSRGAAAGCGRGRQLAAAVERLRERTRP